MPFFNLKRLIPPTKVWKVFTKKLIKLHKPNRSKAIKKFKHKSSSKKLGWRSSLSIQPKKFKIKSSSHTLIHKRPPSIFVDQLFIEHVPSVKQQTEKPSCSSSKDNTNRVPETNQDHEITEVMDDEQSIDAADNMWESLFLGSPQMQGINERAEQFIAKFRADMHNQEIVARRS